MKLAFLINNYYPYGGLEKNFLRIARACLDRGHVVTVFTMSWQGERPVDLEVVLVPTSGLTNHGRSQAFAKQLGKHRHAEGYDLIVGFNRLPGLNLYYAADVCYVLDMARRRGFWARFTARYRTYAGFEKAVFAKESATRIMYLSEAEKKNYIRVYNTPEERFVYLPPGIDRERIRAELRPEIRRRTREECGVGDGQFMLIMIGSDFARKGVARAIVALGALPREVREQTRLYVIGKGEAQKMARLAAGAGVRDRVHFLGTRSDVPRFLAGADLLLHPAVTENTGNAILEAMVAGLPVLATEICGYSFHVTKAAAGCLVPEPFAQQEMNRILGGMLRPAELKAWGENAYAYADREDLYSRPQAAVRIIEETAARKKRGVSR
ncbi:MAG: glycosyltransferase family 4 protein [Deltaproteobacteria bacterium]|nr:glycosyltransferase family 4 protein [Deltaproteobacteria bacterium]